MAAKLSATLLRTQTDKRLAALAAQGSEPALEAIIDRYRKPLQAYCRRLLLDRSSAEDVVQQAFLSTWQTLHDGREITDLRSWLYRVVHNGAINALRKSGYRHEELSDLLRGDDAPEEDLEKRIAVRRALAGLASLPELQREALLRTALEGHSHDEVARELGLSAGAVRGLVYRARASLRSAATALTPLPLVALIASAGSRGGPSADRVAELVAGGGAGATATAVLLKGGATAMTVGALAGGAVVSEHALDRPAVAPQAAAADARGDRGSNADALEPVSTPAVAALAVTTHRGRRGGDDDGDDDRRRSGSSGRGSGPAVADTDSSGPSECSGRRRSGRRRADGDDDDRRGPSRRSGRRGGGGDDNSGSGSGGGGDSSGPGDGGDTSGGDGGSGGSGSGSGDSGDTSGGEVVAPTATPLATPTDGDGSGGDSSGSGSGGGDVTMTERAAETVPEDSSSGDGGGGSGSG
jgi:RNA polymerase sigma factor (sigma-70 family)